MADNRPIAVFDSGLGGLTVVRAIRRRLPDESIIYFGDTARVPYGIKSSPTISRFAVEIVRFLLQYKPKCIVVACNTASAVALDTLRATFDLPIWNVIDPGAAAAAAISPKGPIALLATEATVASEAYPRAIRRLDPDAEIFAQAAPLLVPIVEEGRSLDDPLVRLAIEGYLKPLLQRTTPAGVLLGCTHYPLLAPAFKDLLGPGIALIDSAEQTATMLAADLSRLGLAAEADAPSPSHQRQPRREKLTCLVSDNPDRFGRIGSRFLGDRIEQVHYISPDIFFKAAGLAQPVTVDVPV